MPLMYLLRKYAYLTYTFLLLLGRFLVLCVIVAGPWKNGGADLEYQRFFLWLAFGSGICALGTVVLAPREKRKETNYFNPLFVSIPLILALALCALQIKPLSEGVLAKASPYVLELKEFLVPTFENEDAKGDVANPNVSESLAGFTEAAFPLTDDSNFKVEEALQLEESLERETLGEIPTWGDTISVYPLATRSWLPLFWAGFLLVFSTAILFNSSESRKILFIVAVFVGVSYALLCLALRANPKLCELSPLSAIVIKGDEFKYWFGTYANKNCCAGYLVLCLAPCVFLASRVLARSARLIKEEREGRKKENKGSSSRFKAFHDENWKIVLGELFDLFNRWFVLWAVLLVVLLAAIIASLSRGATIAAAAMLVGTLVIWICKKEIRPYWFVFLVIGVLAVGVVQAVGLKQRVDDRMATLIEEDADGETAVDGDPRWENWRAALETSRNYYWFGSGLGTYSLVNGANDVSMKVGKQFYYAENSFIQNLLELGRVGCVLFVAEYLLLFFCFGRLLWKSYSSEQFAIGVGGIALLIGQLVSSSTDLGIYLSGNLTTFAVLCGAFLGFKKKESHRSSRRHSRSAHTSERRQSKKSDKQNVGWGTICACGGILLVGVLSGSWTLSENKDAVWRDALLKGSRFTVDEYVHLTDKSIDSLITGLEQYVQHRDDSMEVRDRLAELEIARYRLKLCNFLKKERPQDDVKNLWNETSLAIRLQTLLKYQEIGFDVAVSSLRNNSFAQEFILPATVHSMVARHICPLSIRPCLALSEEIPLAFDLSWEQDRSLIELYSRRVVLGGKYDSSALFNSGFYLGAAGLRTLQYKFWRRTLEFNKKNAKDILKNNLKAALTLLAAETPAEQLKDAINDVLPDEPLVMASASSVLGDELKGSYLYSLVVQRAKEYFENRPNEERDSEYYSDYGLFLADVGDYVHADEKLQKACETDPTNYKAFFRRIGLLIKYSDEFHKEEECVKLLNEFSVGKEGTVRARCEKWLEIAERTLKKKQDVEAAKKKTEEERAMDERVRNRSSKSDSTNL